MKPDKVTALFNFIDFLDQNKKEYIKVYIPLVNEVIELGKQRNDLNPENNYKDKRKDDEIQKRIEEKLPVIEKNVTTPFLNRLITLKIWNGDRIFTSIYNTNIEAVLELTRTFTDADIKEIQEYKGKYLSFRTETNTNFLSFEFLFNYLDRLLKTLFDYFKDEEPVPTQEAKTETFGGAGEMHTGQMIYDLRLSRALGRFKKYGEGRQEIKDKLERIKDFEDRLIWYNTHVESLAIYESKGAQIYYRWGNPDQQVKVFCNCNKCRSQVDFDKNHEIIYRKVRAKEIERLKLGINGKNSYKDKLTFLFGTKGFIPDHTPAVWDDHAAEPIVNLRPETDAELRTYNQFVIDDFEKEYRSGNGFTSAYNGFDFVKERGRLNERLNNSPDRKQLLQYIKITIEKHFDYPGSLHTDSKQQNISSHILQQINKKLEQEGHIHNLFARLCFGETINLLGIVGLNSHSLLEYTHVLEIFKFYQYVKQQSESMTEVSQAKTLPAHFESAEELQRFFESANQENDFTPLKKYIRDSYLNVHPNNFTLERLRQIKRNISTWKLKLKDLKKELDLQQFIGEVIADIDLKIEHYSQKQLAETEGEFPYVEKGGNNSDLITTIKNEFEPFKDSFNSESDYQKAVNATHDFFTTGTSKAKGIFVRSGNIKNLAFALGEIWRSQKNEVITRGYLQFYKNTFSIFANQRIDGNLFACNLYKYSITKT